MQIVLKDSLDKILSLLLLSCLFITFSAFLPCNSINPSSETPLECPEDLVLDTDPWSCAASGELPLPTNIQGLCGGNQFNAETFDGGTLSLTGSLENGDLSVFAINFEPGTHHIQYMVNDSCDNVFECEFEVVVIPNPTTISVKQNVVVTLSSTSIDDEALATIYPETIDNGSVNPCLPIKLEIRKDIDLCGISGNATYNADGHPNDGDSDPNGTDYDPDGGQSVKFCCEDATNTLYDVNGDGINDVGYVRVWMRLWEDNDLDGFLGSAGDTYYETWTFVKVEDSLAQVILCPSDVTITCDTDYTNFDITGSASAYGSCGSLEVEYQDVIIDLNACYEGNVKRRWHIVGNSDIFCEQIITMEDLDVPVSVSFTQVQDLSFENCPDIMEIGEPTWIAGPCDVIEYTVDTDTSYFEDGACQKIVNHFNVINWCDYKPDDPSWDGNGIWEHTQVIKIFEETKPIIADCEDKIFEVNDHSDIDNDSDLCETMITLTNIATDLGSVNCQSGWLQWQVKVDLWGDGVYDLEYSSSVPSFDNEFDDTNGNGIPDIYLSPTHTGEEVNIQLPDIGGALSNHQVMWFVRDGCNNVSTCSYDFLVIDKTSPTVACPDSIIIGLAPMGQTILWANKYISNAMDNCSSTENIRYTFSETHPVNDPLYVPERKSSSYVLNYYDLYKGSVQLPIYIWDENGNFTSCEIVFIIDPNLILNTEDTKEIHSNLLYQNQPNPFRLSTMITFNLHRASPVQLTFMNATSKKTIVIEIAGKEGLNTYELERNLLTGQGLYYYTIITNENKETKKMILID